MPLATPAKHLHPGKDCAGDECKLCEKAATNPNFRARMIARLGITSAQAEEVLPWRGPTPYRKPTSRATMMKPGQQKRKDPGFGAGSEAKALLASLDINPKPGCPCIKRMLLMDLWGTKTCRANFDVIVGWMREGQGKWGWKEKLKAAALAVKTGLAFKINWLDPFPGIIEEAIHRAEEKEKVIFDAIKKKQLERPGITVADLAKVIEGPFTPMPDGWEMWPAAHEAMKLAFTNAVQKAKTLTPPAFSADRGIVMSAGGSVYFACAYICISLLRSHGCKLPVELWYLGPEEMDPRMLVIIESLGDVRCIDMKAYVRQLPPSHWPRSLAGWESKNFSVLYSSFREVLFLDADQVPVRDPSFLFDTEQYKSKGAAFWQDLEPMGYTVTKIAFEVAGLPVPGGQPRRDREDCPGEYRPFESGQFMVNKGVKEQYQALWLSAWLCERSDFWFRHTSQRHWLIYGDKDTFYLAWERLQVPYAMPPGPGWCGARGSGGAFLQKDFKGRLLFQHRVQPSGIKWSLHGENKNDPRFKLHDECQELINGLRRKWVGHPWDWGDQSKEDNEVAAKVAGRWVFSKMREQPAIISLHVGGLIASGTEQAHHWCVRHMNGVPTVIVSSSRKATAFLHQDDKQNWIDRERNYALTPASPPGWEFVNPKDYGELEIYTDVVLRNEYRLPDQFSDQDLVIDIGGNTGSFCKAVLDRGAGKVITVEPMEENYKLLLSNLTKFHDKSKWVAIGAAAWRSDRENCQLSAKVDVGAVHSGGWTIVHASGEKMVPAMPFDSIVRIYAPEGKRIRFLKVDCEGSEYPILYTSRLLHLVDEIAVEWHEKSDLAPDAVVEGLDNTGRCLAGFLERAGFRIEFVDRVAGLGMIFARR